MSCRVLRSYVFRLNEESTFIGRLLLSARPDVERKKGWEDSVKKKEGSSWRRGRQDVRK